MGSKLRVEIDRPATLNEALAALSIPTERFLWMVHGEPQDLGDPPLWWGIMLYYLMQRCAPADFPDDLRQRVTVWSGRIYSRAWAVADRYRARKKRPGVGGVAETYATALGELTIAEAAKIAGVIPSTIHRRMNRGLTLDQAMSIPRYRRMADA